jgi:hypothetical protein
VGQGRFAVTRVGDGHGVKDNQQNGSLVSKGGGSYVAPAVGTKSQARVTKARARHGLDKVGD